MRSPAVRHRIRLRNILVINTIYKSGQHVKALTLIEIMIAVTIFSILSVSLYSFLRTAIVVREKVEREQGLYHSLYLGLAMVAQELRNTIPFRESNFGFKGDQKNVQFYTLVYDYPSKAPQLVHLSYGFNNGALIKVVKEPFAEEEQILKTYNFFEDLQDITFHYFRNDQGESLEVWEEEQELPQAVKIELVYKDERGRSSSLNKYVFFYRQ